MLFGQISSIWADSFYLSKSGCSLSKRLFRLAKVFLFGQISFICAKGGCIWAEGGCIWLKWLCLNKICSNLEKCLYLGKIGSVCANWLYLEKLVVFG